MCLCQWKQHISWNSNRDIFLSASKDGTILIIYFHLEFRSVKYLSISRPLKQLLKISVRESAQECLFGIFFANYHQSICDRVYFKQNSMLLAYSSEHLKTDDSEVWKVFFHRHLVLDIQIVFIIYYAWICKSFIAKSFDGIILKMNAASPISNKEQKAMFPVVSRCDAHSCFTCLIVYVHDRARKWNIAPEKSGAITYICQAFE